MNDTHFRALNSPLAFVSCLGINNFKARSLLFLPFANGFQGFAFLLVVLRSRDHNNLHSRVKRHALEKPSCTCGNCSNYFHGKSKY